MDNKAAYETRKKRLQDAVELKTPDRVPTFFFAHYWPTRQYGVSNRDAMYDYDKLSEAVKKAIVDLEPDGYMPMHPLMALGPTMEFMGYRQLEWPGHAGVDPNVSFQYLDKEYMKAEEYDDYLLDPTGFYLRKYLPRISSAFEAFASLPEFPALFYTAIIHSVRGFASQKLADAFQELAKAGNEMREMLRKSMALGQELTELGFPAATSAGCAAPFDVIADYYRGSKGAMLDLFRNKEKLLATMERMVHFLPNYPIEIASRAENKVVFMPLHWCLDGFMSPKQFETFYWPQLRAVTMKLIDAGLTPCLFWEGDCTSRLEVIKDVPPGTCIYLFERTDIFKAKKVLGDTVCIRGNVPATMLMSGTPDQVSDYCKKLIDEVGRDGGFIMDASVGIPDEARYENVKAMFRTTQEYGVYR